MTATEGALIARLLVDPRPLSTLHLTPEDFESNQYRRAYRAMLGLTTQGKPIDLVTLREAGADVADVLDTITPAHRADPSEYADIIRRDAFRRRYVNRLNDLVALAEGAADPQALVTELHDTLTVLSSDVEPEGTLGRINLADFRTAPDPPYEGVLAPQGTTILYGEGGDGKGWVAARLVSRLIATGMRVAILDFEMQPQEWGYRLDKFGVSLNDVLYFSPATTLDHWATHETAQLLKAEGVGFLVVDSAMYASDVDDPYSPSGAVGYGRARRRLNNLPALLLAHVTGNVDKVFGSVFWKNECRISWRLSKDYQTRRRVMECRKANGYGWLEGKEYAIEFNEEQGELELV